MERIGHLLADGDYDLVLLEELWMRPDHETIKSKLGPGLHMTEYDDLNQCQGTLWPWGCSGLAIVSRSPVKMCESFLILSISDSPSWRRTSLSLSSRGRVVEQEHGPWCSASRWSRDAEETCARQLPIRKGAS